MLSFIVRLICGPIRRPGVLVRCVMTTHRKLVIAALAQRFHNVANDLGGP
jgi:hypothetical protein